MAVVDRSEYSTIRFWDHLVQRGATNAIETIRDVIRREDLTRDALALAHAKALHPSGELGKTLRRQLPDLLQRSSSRPTDDRSSSAARCLPATSVG